MQFIHRKGLYYIFSNNFVRQKKFAQKQCLFSKSVTHNNMPTVNEKKFVAPDGDKNSINAYSEVEKVVEKGSDAISHSVLMNQLQNCSTVEEQFKTFCSTMSLTPEDVEKRKEFCHYLHEMLRPYFPNFRLHLFGSSINGLGFKGCDVDISIQTIFDGKDYSKIVKKDQVPTPDSVLQEDVVAHLHPRNLLHFVKRILYKHGSYKSITFIKARCPLLKFSDSKYGLACDFSYSNEASLRNTRLIQLICRLDERFSMLAKVIRYWGKHGEFVGDIDKFNSYAFSLLVVHFLQLTQPPVLPSIQEMIEKSEYLTHGDVNDDHLLLQDLKKFEKSKNCQSVDDLLKEYFFYFLNFDFSNMMLPLTSSIMPVSNFTPNMIDTPDKFEFSTVVTQDPFRLNFNATAGATFENCRNYRNAVIEACKPYQDTTHWNSHSNKWGLCTLFQQYGPKLKAKWEKNLIHSIKLPLKTDVGIVKEILQKCLLFECNELSQHNENERTQPSVRLKCNVYYETWKGRNWVERKLQLSTSDPLEVENRISNEILQRIVERSKETRKRILFSFLCECFKNVYNNELCIVLSFKESKYISPDLAIFLKEYIPNVYSKLCNNGNKIT